LGVRITTDLVEWTNASELTVGLEEIEKYDLDVEAAAQ
jgi:hypothetical protein